MSFWKEIFPLLKQQTGIEDRSEHQHETFLHSRFMMIRCLNSQTRPCS